MGLFSFARDAGEKLREKAARLFSGKAEAAELEDAQQDAAQQIREAIEGHELDIDNLEVTLDGHRATLRGSAGTQADREKAVLIAGNVQGVGEVDDQMETEEQVEPARFYEVQRGDTLSKIAKQHYGDAMKYPVIFEANRPMLKDPDRIYPGQVLRIPNL